MSASVALITDMVARRYGVSSAEILSSTRARRVSRPRHVAIFLARRLTRLSTHALGRIFRRHQQTVWNAILVVNQRLDDERFRSELLQLSRDIEAASSAPRPPLETQGQEQN